MGGRKQGRAGQGRGGEGRGVGSGEGGQGGEEKVSFLWKNVSTADSDAQRSVSPLRVRK